MLISARVRGYLCNLIHVSLFRIPIHEKQEKGKGGNGDLNYIWSKDSFVNILNVLKEKDFLQKKSSQFLHNKNGNDSFNHFDHPFPFEIISLVIKVILF